MSAESLRTMPTARGSMFGRAALIATFVSLAGLVVQLVGSVMEADGFTDDPNAGSAIADVAWLGFSLGAILALVTGVVAWLRGRSRASLFDVRAGQAAVAYVAIALLLFLLS